MYGFGEMLLQLNAINAICANCIEDNTSSGNVRDYVEPKLGRFVDYCAGLTTLSSWASLGTALPTSVTGTSDQESTSAEATSQQETTKTASEEATASETVPTSVTRDVSSAASTLDRIEQPTSSSVSESTDTGGSGRNPAWIAGPIVPSVVIAIALIGAGFWWHRRRKRTPKPPSSTEGLAQSDKPQLHSECIPRPTQEQGGTMQAPMAQAPPVSSYSYAELPVNEAPAHEMPTRGRRGP
ncbi:hypothetical protein FALBO_11015 [Fusarium albosuccineum]|uniref:Uncharacterized protein n=1 Tax=Fusarium albosuccineum TaxID=1237068 RepID=A0A8H4L5U2_9HYPO|nr:hypothetical protein FALBO_11015 [Fusarium albosuccineum]